MTSQCNILLLCSHRSMWSMTSPNLAFHREVLTLAARAQIGLQTLFPHYKCLIPIQACPLLLHTLSSLKNKKLQCRHTFSFEFSPVPCNESLPYHSMCCPKVVITLLSTGNTLRVGVFAQLVSAKLIIESVLS